MNDPGSTAMVAKKSLGLRGFLPPNQLAHDACFTPGTARITSMYRLGNDMMKDTLWRVATRSLAAASAAAFHMDKMVCSTTKASTAMAPPSTVNVVRVTLRRTLRMPMLTMFIGVSPCPGVG